MAPKRQLFGAYLMKLFFSGIFFCLFSSVASGQVPTISLPSSFLPPPPPSPAGIQNVGSLQFQAFLNNMSVPQLQMLPSYGANVVSKEILTPVLIKDKRDQSAWLPKSFESSIQGLQFIKPSPLDLKQK